ncbi:hypothetical protein BC332_01827 [Capsicum chinense]|nr:hypothetical protein BC332_01827 [Capsicum chinense]
MMVAIDGGGGCCDVTLLDTKINSMRGLLFVESQVIASSKNKEGGAQDAVEQIKVVALSAVKGLSSVQGEHVATTAARNVNAYGQKEEGPSRWQERKEAKRQMYLMSTEK